MFTPGKTTGTAAGCRGLTERAREGAARAGEVAKHFLHGLKNLLRCAQRYDETTLEQYDILFQVWLIIGGLTAPPSGYLWARRGQHSMVCGSKAGRRAGMQEKYKHQHNKSVIFMSQKSQSKPRHNSKKGYEDKDSFCLCTLYFCFWYW